MKKIWINRASSFEEAREFDENYYRAMTGAQRLEAVQFLREAHEKFNKGKNENRKGLRRFIKVIQQA